MSKTNKKDNDSFVETVEFNGKKFDVYIDDAGQTYVVKYKDDKGNVVEECVGAYVTDYMSYIEYMHGTPDLCEKMKKIKSDQQLARDSVPCDCDTPHDHGYCDSCPYQDYDYYVLCQLRDLGVLDRHGDILNQRFAYLLNKKRTIKKYVNLPVEYYDIGKKVRVKQDHQTPYYLTKTVYVVDDIIYSIDDDQWKVQLYYYNDSVDCGTSIITLNEYREGFEEIEPPALMG